MKKTWSCFQQTMAASNSLFATCSMTSSIYSAPLNLYISCAVLKMLTCLIKYSSGTSNQQWFEMTTWILLRTFMSRAGGSNGGQDCCPARNYCSGQCFTFVSMKSPMGLAGHWFELNFPGVFMATKPGIFSQSTTCSHSQLDKIWELVHLVNLDATSTLLVSV